METCLYIMCGPAGCGKSTWIKEDMAYNDGVLAEIGEPGSSIVISRDAVRFSLISDEDEYFAKENLVFDTFVKQINKAIYNPKYDHIYIDATHLTKGSRRKLLNDIAYEECHVVAVNFYVPEEIVVAQNAQRTGRALVPEDVVRNMCRSFVPATAEEEGIDFVLEVRREEEKE